MKKAWIVLILLLTSLCYSFAQKDSLKQKDYSFIILDSPAQIFTMRQADLDYLSAYRLFARGLYSVTRSDKLAYLIQIGVQVMFFRPITHEGAHRIILTGTGIGSIVRPLDGEVVGVTNQTLEDLRDRDLPAFIRMHTSGLESDYMLTKRIETIGSFEQDDFKNYMIEYWLRKIEIIQYYALGLFKYEAGFTENPDELKRDIVGFDTYGAVRHLFRPTMDFEVYTSYSELTPEERTFVNRLGVRSFLNLLNPLMIGKSNFKLNTTTSINAGMGYAMAPFGDFIDENVWIRHKSLNFGIYVRQFQNKANWFNGFGISLIDYHPAKRLSADFTGHFWQQPVNLDFNTSEHFTGGAFDADFRYFFPNKTAGVLHGFSLDLGFIYKTKGFLPEEIQMNEHLGFRIGSTIRM